MRLIKTLIVLGINVNGLVQEKRGLNSSPLDDALRYPRGNPNLQIARLLRGYGAQLTDLDEEDSEEAEKFLRGWDGEHALEKKSIKQKLDAILVDPRFQEVNKMIMEYVVPPSQEINYTYIPRGMSEPIKAVIDGSFPPNISQIIADYTQKSWVEISVIEKPLVEISVIK